MQSLTLANGRAIPQLGYGVYTMTSAEVEEHLPEAIAAAVLVTAIGKAMLHISGLLGRNARVPETQK